MGSWRIRSRPRNDPEEEEEEEEAVVGCTYVSPGFDAAARSQLPTFRVSGDLKRPITIGGAQNYKAHILKSQNMRLFKGDVQWHYGTDFLRFFLWQLEIAVVASHPVQQIGRAHV